MHGGMIIVFSRMNRVLGVDVENQRAVVQPGVVNADLSLRRRTCRASFCSGSFQPKILHHRRQRFGKFRRPAHAGLRRHHESRDSLEAVLPDRRILRLGSPALDSPGYDLPGLFVGSEGTLALITEITVKLTRMPETVKTLLAIFDTVDDATETVVDITARAITPAACEMIDGWTLRVIEDYVHAGFPIDSAAVILFEIEGLQESVRRKRRQLQMFAWRITLAKSALPATPTNAIFSGKAAKTPLAR